VADYSAATRRAHCLDLAKLQTQQGRLFFLILAVSCIESASDRQVTFRYMREVTRHRLGKGAKLEVSTRHRLGKGVKLEKLKLNFEFGSNLPTHQEATVLPHAAAASVTGIGDDDTDFLLSSTHASQLLSSA
jgi:hypothetical protein